MITKLTDLGLTQIAEHTDPVNSKVKGTAHYLAPEQITRKEKLGPATDIYSLGATFHHLLCGETPFSGNTAKEIALQRLKVAPLPVNNINNKISPDFSALISRMMSEKQKDRPQNGDELIAEIEKIDSSKQKAVVKAKARSSIKVVKVKAKEEKKKSRLKPVLIIVFILIAITGLSFLAYSFS
ncbi:MAG: serine/threonine protein kinase [Planctomycetota bacterium]|jgi:serine/threonine-protein kinase